MNKLKIENGKLKNSIFASFASLALLFGATSCEQLQDTLSSEQSVEMEKDTGIASIDGTTWYFDGISTTDFSSTSGAALAISFSKKVAISATEEVEDDGTIKQTLNLTGSLSATYTNTTGQLSTIAVKISQGKIILDSTTSPATSISAGSLSADGKTFRLDMTPVCYLLDSETANGNEISVLEVKLSGFVCAEGSQKGRALSVLDKKIAIKPFYDDETITSGVIFSTASSTKGKYITIPTNGSVSLAEGATVEFESSESKITLTSDDFTLGTSDDGITILCNEEFKGSEFTGKFKVSGFVPELNASSYTRTFTVNITPQYVTLDGSLDEEAWSKDAKTSDDSYSEADGYDLTKLYVTNDDTYLYVAVEGKFTFGSGDRIVLMIDNTSSSATGKSSSDSDYNSYYGPATNATFSGVDFFLSHFIASSEMDDYYWVDGGRTDVSASATTSTSGVIEYKIPLSSIASAAFGNTLKVFAAVTSYEWTTKNEMTLQDCIPSAAATVSDGGQTVIVDFANALEYTVSASEE